MALSLALSALDLDLKTSRLFYTTADGFFLENRPPWVWLYRYGTLPGIIFIALSIVAYFLSTIRPGLDDLRRPAAIVVLSALLGSGIIANAVLKPYWGRPRPCQVREFGGEWGFRQVFSPGTPGRGLSFPSGHCTMAFLFVAAFPARRRYPRAASGLVLFGLAYGLLMSATRVVQGAHFVTDTLWGLGVILLSAQLFDAILPEPLGRPGAATSRVRPLPLAALLLSLAVLGLDFAAHRPFFEDHRR